MPPTVHSVPPVTFNGVGAVVQRRSSATVQRKTAPDGLARRTRRKGGLSSCDRDRAGVFDAPRAASRAVDSPFVNPGVFDKDIAGIEHVTA
jgi:hypothetical protein